MAKPYTIHKPTHRLVCRDTGQEFGVIQLKGCSYCLNLTRTGNGLPLSTPAKDAAWGPSIRGGNKETD